MAGTPVRENRVTGQGHIRVPENCRLPIILFHENKGISDYYPHFADEDIGAQRGHIGRKKQSKNSDSGLSLSISAMEGVM